MERTERKLRQHVKKTLNMIKYTQVENKFIHFIYLLISHTFVVPLPDNPDKRYNNSPNN